MKSFEKSEAIKLRGQGLSLKDISQKLNVSKSVVSLWTREIKISDNQKNVLRNRKLIGNTFCRDAYKNIREEYQKEGALKAKENNLNHIAGCMLYWAEGAKRKNSLIFVNSDINMMRFFYSFLKRFFNVENRDVTITIYYYDGNGLHEQDIKKYWIQGLNLEGCNVTKSYVKHAPKIYSKRNKLNYGTCRLTVHSTKIIQHIFGAIQEYAGFKNDKWLMNNF